MFGVSGWRAAVSWFHWFPGPGWAGRGGRLTDRLSSGSWLIPAALQPAQNSFLHREMRDSDGCPGNRGGAKPFPFSANERTGGWGGGVCGRGHHKVVGGEGRGLGSRVTSVRSNGNEERGSGRTRKVTRLKLSWHASFCVNTYINTQHQQHQTLVSHEAFIHSSSVMWSGFLNRNFMWKHKRTIKASRDIWVRGSKHMKTSIVSARSIQIKLESTLFR